MAEVEGYLTMVKDELIKTFGESVPLYTFPNYIPTSQGGKVLKSFLV
jgi:hypothetical protein